MGGEESDSTLLHVWLELSSGMKEQPRGHLIIVADLE